MINVRLAYVFVVLFAATLHSNGIAVSGMENSDKALIGNTDPGLDSHVQRRLRGAVKEDATDEERGALLSPAVPGAEKSLAAKFSTFFTKEGFTSAFAKLRFTERLKNLGAWISKQPKSLRDKLMKLFRKLSRKNNKKAGEADDKSLNEQKLARENEVPVKMLKNTESELVVGKENTADVANAHAHAVEGGGNLAAVSKGKDGVATTRKEENTVTEVTNVIKPDNGGNSATKLDGGGRK